MTKGLKLQRMGRDIGQVQILQNRHRRRAVIIGRAADQAEPGQRDQGIDLATGKIALDRGPPVEPTGKGGQNGKASFLHLTDHAIIMRGVGGQHIAAHHHQAHGRNRIGGLRQIGRVGGDAMTGQIRMIQPHLGVIDRCRRARPLKGAVAGIAADQEADHLLDIVVRPAQPILHGQKPRAQILRLAGDEFQDLGQAAQKLHLLFAGIGRRLF